MEQGRGGMGSKKHGVSGHPGRSPRFKHNAQIEANKEADNRKAKKPLPFDSVEECFRDR